LSAYRDIKDDGDECKKLPSLKSLSSLQPRGAIMQNPNPLRQARWTNAHILWHNYECTA